jgi:hypothetical protein
MIRGNRSGEYLIPQAVLESLAGPLASAAPQEHAARRAGATLSVAQASAGKPGTPAQRMLAASWAGGFGRPLLKPLLRTRV